MKKPKPIKLLKGTMIYGDLAKPEESSVTIVFRYPEGSMPFIDDARLLRLIAFMKTDWVLTSSKIEK